MNYQIYYHSHHFDTDNLIMAEYLDQLTQLLRLESLDENTSFAFVEKKFGVKPSAVVLSFLVFLLILTFISNASGLVVAIGCCVVPAYFTFIVLESGQSALLHKYLIYWIIFAIFEVISPLLSLVLTSMLYILLRVGVTVAILHPESSIGNQLFQNYISPFLNKHEQVIDRNIDNAMKQGKGLYKKGKEVLRNDLDFDC